MKIKPRLLPMLTTNLSSMLYQFLLTNLNHLVSLVMLQRLLPRRSVPHVLRKFCVPICLTLLKRRMPPSKMGERLRPQRAWARAGGQAWGKRRIKIENNWLGDITKASALISMLWECPLYHTQYNSLLIILGLLHLCTCWQNLGQNLNMKQYIFAWFPFGGLPNPS